MLNYERLSENIAEQIKNDRVNNTLPQVAFCEDEVVRRNNERDQSNIIRTAFIRDIDKIIHCPYYNRYADKTQVFSFYKNDDISRRSLHVQLVSRIARTIGKALGLNLDLIEAIALGHDIGHTPFGHAGEAALSDCLGEPFRHNEQSLRVVDILENEGNGLNLSYEVRMGIVGHTGEYIPETL